MPRFRVRLKDHLKKIGMTQLELAEKINIDKAALSQFANGKKQSINKDHLAKIMDYFGFKKIDDLIEFVPHKGTGKEQK